MSNVDNAHELDVRPGMGSPSPSDVVDVAVTHFADLGFHGTKLEKIAKKSGMSKRMIHYHFGDKLGLYNRALSEALSRLHVSRDALQLDTEVPVEAVRKFVDGMFEAFAENEEAMRLVQWDNLTPPVEIDTRPAPFDEADFILYLDRILLLGQDAGAFRPGITAQDLCSLVVSVLYHRQSNRNMFLNLFNVDLMDASNREGTRSLLVDTILAFLTANIPDSGQRSYLEPAEVKTAEDSHTVVYEDLSEAKNIFSQSS